MMAAIHPVFIVFLVAIAIFALVILVLIGRFIKLWIQAYFAKAGVSMFDLIGMSLRKVNPHVIVLSKIRAVQSGLALATRDMESHYLAGGRVPNVITALIAANRANIELSWKTATAGPGNSSKVRTWPRKVP